MTPTGARTCPTTARTPAKFPSNDTDPAHRNSWGVDINRNFQVGSVFDGFQGASTTDCLSGNFAGLFEHSEPEVRNETWVQTTFRNIKFANNIHSSGGLFMWPPGSYTPARVPLPYPPYGTLNFFDQTAQERPRRDQVPPRHGDPPAADRSRDRRALLGRRQLARTRRTTPTGSSVSTSRSVTPTTTRTRRPASSTTCGAGQQPPFGDTTNDCLDNEGFHEAMEFASGNYGLLDAALAYAQRHDGAGRRTRPATPTVNVDASTVQASPATRRPRSTTRSTARRRPRPRPSGSRRAPARCRCRSSCAPGTTLKWIATDFKGNVVGGQVAGRLGVRPDTGTVGGTVPATLSPDARPAGAVRRVHAGRRRGRTSRRRRPT